MIRSKRTQKPAPEQPRGAASEHRPFTRLDHHARATTEEFDREQMGIAAKE